MAEWELQSRSRDGPEKGNRTGVGFKTNVPHSVLSAETLGHREVKQYLEPPYRFLGLMEAGRRR